MPVYQSHFSGKRTLVMKKRQLKISVLVLTKDRPEHLRRALTSLVKQSIQADEVVVVDESTQVNIKSIVAEFTGRINLLYRKFRIQSIPKARNLAISLASGDIIIFLDDDLVAERDYLKKFLSYFQKNPKTVALMGRLLNGLPQNPYASTQYSFYERWLLCNFKNLQAMQPLSRGFVADCEIMGFRRSFIKKFTFYTDSPRGYKNDDAEMGIQWLEANKHIYFVNIIVLLYNSKLSIAIPIPLTTQRRGSSAA